MEWIEKVLQASPLSVALLVCVILALGMFLVLRWLITWLAKSRPADDASAKDLAILAEKVQHLERDMDRMAAEHKDFREEFVEWRTILHSLKESMEEKLERVLKAVEERRD